MRNRLSPLGAALLVLIGALHVSAHAGDTSGELVFGFLPIFPLRQFDRISGVAEHHFSKAVGRPVRPLTSSTAMRFTQRVANEEFDILLLTPGDYVRVARDRGYRLLARDRTGIHVKVIASTDRLSPIDPDLRRIRGWTVAIPPGSTSASLVFRCRLRAAGLDPDRDLQLLRVGTHSACLQAFRSGRADACVAPDRALAISGLREGVDYRVVADAKSPAGVLVAVHPRVPLTDQQGLERGIATWADRWRGDSRLASLSLGDFVSADDEQVARWLGRSATGVTECAPL